MKYVVVIFIVLFSVISYGQTDHLELDSRIKNEFKRIENLDKEAYNKVDYEEFIQLLEATVKESPDNTEARYFLGYAYSRKNANDGCVMINANLDLVLKASEQFEEIIKLTPKYKGEIIGHNPYDKIAADWSGLALKYLYDKKKDSAIWAFKQAEKRGGFSAYKLQLYKEKLNACSKNAVLFSLGDIPTFSLNYLQTVENFREDISVVDITLLESKWYPKYLVENSIISFDISNEELKTIDYIEWNDKLITIDDFSWILKPSYDEYIFRGDRILLSFLKQNKFKRDIYFTTGFKPNTRLSLDAYISEGLLVDKLLVSKEKDTIINVNYELIKRMLKMTEIVNVYNDSDIKDVCYFRIMALYEISGFFEKNENKKAINLVKLIDKYIDEAIFPFRYKEYLKFYTDCKKFVND